MAENNQEPKVEIQPSVNEQEEQPKQEAAETPVEEKPTENSTETKEENQAQLKEQKTEEHAEEQKQSEAKTVPLENPEESHEEKIEPTTQVEAITEEQPSEPQPVIIHEMKIKATPQKETKEDYNPDMDILNNLSAKIPGHKKPEVKRYNPITEIQNWYKDLVKENGAEAVHQALISVGLNVAGYVAAAFLLKPVTEFFAKME